MQKLHRKIKQATSTPIGKIIFFSLLAVLLAGIASGLIYWQTHKKQIIREQLESAIHGKTGGLYTLRYAALDLDEISGYLSVKEMSVGYDSLKYQSLLKQGNSPAILLNIHIPEITVSGVKTPKALLDNEIEGTKLELKNPELEIIYTMAGKDSSRTVPDREIYEQVLGNLHLINIDTVIISGAHISTINLETKETGIEFTNASVQLVNVRVDSAAGSDTTRYFFAKEVVAACESGSLESANKRYNYKMQGIDLNSATRTVSIKSFAFVPKLNEAEFVRSLPAQEDRFDFLVKDITIKNVDFLKLTQEDITADSVLVGESSFKIYRDLNMPRDSKNRVGSYPHQAIAKIPLPINIKKIVLHDAFVEYKEKSKITKESGKVRFNKVYAVINNFTNKKEQVAVNNKMTADISCRFMDKAPFKVSWVFYLQNPNGRFDVEGTMGGMSAKEMSVLTEPMGPARIEDGKVNSLYFNLEGNNYSMSGMVKLLYEDIKVALLERDKDSKIMDKKGLTSLVANILIKNSNPSGKKDVIRVADIAYKRDTNRSIFNMTWKAIFQGLKVSIGIKK